MAVLGAAAVGALLILLATTFDLGGSPAPDDTAGPSVAPVLGDDPQPTVVLATFDELQPDRGASQAMVLAHDVSTGNGLLLLVPTTTVADIPGHGLLQLGRAYGFGQGPLLDVTLDNLLGVDLDGVAGVSRQGWSSLFSRIDGLTIDVPTQLTEETAGGRRVRFEPGEQFLDGPRLAEYLTFVAPDESELQRQSRVGDVMAALLTKLHAEPDLVDAIFADGAPMIDGIAAERVRALLELLARDHADGRLEIRTLPVTPIGGGDESSYRLDDERVRTLVDNLLADSVPRADAPGGRALQILNGNGQPGIGQHAAERLTPSGFRVVLTGNADNFEYAQTRILVYDDSPEQLAVARQIRDLLGVGEIAISASPVAVVDVTIILGADFAP